MVEKNATPSNSTARGETDAIPPFPADLNLPHATANGYTKDEKKRASRIEFDRQSPDPDPDIETTMLEIVSRLTGYPVEMLGLDMDIEAELGIDSIKRVEILSNLEEAIPDLPAVSPEIMGSLKTLGQIVEFVKQPGGGPAAEARACLLRLVEERCKDSRGPADAGRAAIRPGRQGIMVEAIRKLQNPL